VPVEVSVVIPTRDRASRLRAALASALAQARVSVDVIVVDDGSSPDTARAIAELATGPVRLLRHDTPLGVSRARNAGIEAARAPWIAFLDDDDLWAPGKLAAQLARAQQTGAGLVYTSVVVLDDGGDVVGELTARPEAALPAEMRETNAIGTPSSVLARTELLRRAGGFDPRLSIFADWDLILRLLRLTSAAACAEHLTAYTEHASNMSLARAGELHAELELMAAGPAGPVGGAALERWLAASRRRAGAGRRGAAAYLQAAARHRDPAALARGLLALATPRGAAALRSARARRRVGRPPWLPVQSSS
jgi:hypothetical protein